MAMSLELRRLHEVDLPSDLFLHHLRGLLCADVQLAHVVVAGGQLPLSTILQAGVLTDELNSDIQGLTRLAAEHQLLLLDLDEHLLQVRTDVGKPLFSLVGGQVLLGELDPTRRSLLRREDLPCVPENLGVRMHGVDLLDEFLNDKLSAVPLRLARFRPPQQNVVVASQDPEGVAVRALEQVFGGLRQRQALCQRANHARDVGVVLQELHHHLLVLHVLGEARCVYQAVVAPEGIQDGQG
mmetsp:Transcript_8811/g.25273  ORF Transcript_8811/g.25273 Transcript_8811/m.25273 type:complete len:240 (-) Transcript_8811:753-1472(-)